MSRETQEDFNVLVEFIKVYRLEELAKNERFLELTSQQHKRYYSYLTCVAEITHLSKNTALQPNLTQPQLNFITESCSDIGSALFVITHGAYKAGKMMLRSSIETFHKGFNLDDIPNIDKEKSIYNVFDNVKVLPFFSTEPASILFETIHNFYKTLCLDTHTATKINMQHITALKYFPTFNLTEASLVSDISMKLVSAYNCLLCLKYNTVFHAMHHRNKENILESITKKFRPIIHGVS